MQQRRDPPPQVDHAGHKGRCQGQPGQGQVPQYLHNNWYGQQKNLFPHIKRNHLQLFRSGQARTQRGFGQGFRRARSCCARRLFCPRCRSGPAAQTGQGGLWSLHGHGFQKFAPQIFLYKGPFCSIQGRFGVLRGHIQSLGGKIFFRRGGYHRASTSSARDS